jgi:uncharacterized membrane protein YeaQ/YmgE (transglycosylase-associated protein family)
MDLESLVIFLLIGLAAGWVAGHVMRGHGFGLGGNLAVGVVGAVAGGFIFRLLNIAAVGLVGEFVMALVGAIVLLFLVSALRRV